ncbi:MAG: hypothetical protein AAGA48_11590 [Myxococcota bacterium]
MLRGLFLIWLVGCGPPPEVTAPNLDAPLERINNAFLHIDFKFLEFANGRRERVGFAQFVLSDNEALCDQAKLGVPMAEEEDLVAVVIHWVQLVNWSEWGLGMRGPSEVTWNEFVAGPDRFQSYVEMHYLQRTNGETTAFYGSLNTIDADEVGAVTLNAGKAVWFEDRPINLRAQAAAQLEVDRLAPDGWDLDIDRDGTPDYRSINAQLDASFRSKKCRHRFTLLERGPEGELPDEMLSRIRR